MEMCNTSRVWSFYDKVIYKQEKNGAKGQEITSNLQFW